MDDDEPVEPSVAAKLVERIMNGDSRAESELVERYQQGVLTLLRHQGCDRSLAEDLAQETFLLLIPKLRAGELRNPESLSSFIRSIAKYLAIEHFRKVRLHPKVGDLSMAEDVIDPKPRPDLESWFKEEIGIVRRVLSELKIERDRQVLYRFWILEEDKELICAALGVPPKNFNAVLHRARNRFMELWEKRGRKP